MSRSAAAVLAAAYAALVVFAVFWPTATYASGSVETMARLLYAVGVPTSVTPAVVEFGSNVVLFVPFSVLGSVLLDRWSWSFWLGLGMLASGFIELAQLVFLSARSASLLDVLANSLGALLGALLARWGRGLRG